VRCKLWRVEVAGGRVFLCALCVERFSGFNTEDTEKGHRGHRETKNAEKIRTSTF
jgi:hypothetical protein